MLKHQICLKLYLGEIIRKRQNFGGCTFVFLATGLVPTTKQSVSLNFQ